VSLQDRILGSTARLAPDVAA